MEYVFTAQTAETSLAERKLFYGAHQKNFNEDRPTYIVSSKM